MKSLVLHSGGLDSTLCLLMALEESTEVVSLGVNYGQHHLIELEYAKKQCEKYGIERRLLQVGWDKPRREIPIGRSVDKIGKKVSSAFLPGRNAIFLTLACAEAAGINAEKVWIGVNSMDFSGYPDCTPEFIESFKAMIQVAIPGGPEVITPLQHMSKPEIALKADGFGIKQGDTWSCYRPHISEVGVVPCGQCDACVLHNHAWKQLKK